MAQCHLVLGPFFGPSIDLPRRFGVRSKPHEFSNFLRACTMDRRHWLGLIGSGVGVSMGAGAHAADGHASVDKADGGLMAPVHSLHAHFCGIHIAKNNPRFQLVAQHYCMSRSEEMHQCLLYDSCEKNARLLGVEYIVSDRIYRQLPDGEKKY